MRVLRQRLGIAPVRSAQPYATHLPVLVALGRTLPVRSVLELGTGDFSTACFLDTAVFPHLERLVSVENDVAWGERMRPLLERDERAVLHVVDGTVSDALDRAELAPSGFDLVFCDDSTSADERSRTIATVAERCGRNTVVVIHDFEVEPYQAASATFTNRWVSKAFYPNTGVCWHDARVDVQSLRRLDRVISRVKQRTPLTDQRAWLAALA